MTVRITSRVVYTIVDSTHNNESFDVIGVNGLEKHLENCLGGFVDKLYSSSCIGNVIKDKQNIFKFLVKHKVELETIYELSDLIQEIKQPSEEDDD